MNLVKTITSNVDVLMVFAGSSILIYMLSIIPLSKYNYPKQKLEMIRWGITIGVSVIIAGTYYKLSKKQDQEVDMFYF